MINNDGTINTLGVKPATSEKGLVKVVPKSNELIKIKEIIKEVKVDNGLSSEEIDKLIHTSEIIKYLGKNYIEDRLFLLSLCQKYRVNSVIIKNLLEGCNVEAYKKSSLIERLTKKVRIIVSILKS